MKISARNQIKGVVEGVEKGAVSSIVAIKVADASLKATEVIVGVDH